MAFLWLMSLGAGAQPLAVGRYQVAWRTRPEPAPVGRVVLQLTVTADGRPAADLPVEVQVRMADMDMGTQRVQARTTPAGMVEIPIRLSMAGKWRVRIGIGPASADAVLTAGGADSRMAVGQQRSPHRPAPTPSSTAGLEANGVPARTAPTSIVPPGSSVADSRSQSPSPPGPPGPDLSLDATVRLGLSRNPDLLSALQELGVANATVIQAELISNPTLSGQVKFPDRSGFETYWEVNLTQNILDFFLQGARVDLATTQREAAVLRVARVLFEQSTALKSAYFRLQADQQELQLTATMSEAAAAAEEMATRQRRAGNLSQLDLVRQQAVRLESQNDVIQSQRELAVDRELLVRLLGTPDGYDELRLATILPPLPSADPELESLQQLAQQHRQEIRAARLDLQAAQQGEELATRFFGIDEVRVGVGTSREVEGVQVTGPVVQLPLPIFQQNQGQRARYRAQGQVARLAEQSAVQNARYEVRQAYRKLQAARLLVTATRDHLIPARHQARQLAEQQFNNMFLGVYGLLTIYREELEAQKKLVEGLRDYWTAHAELEKAIGQDLPAPRIGE